MPDSTRALRADLAHWRGQAELYEALVARERRDFASAALNAAHVYRARVRVAVTVTAVVTAAVVAVLLEVAR